MGQEVSAGIVLTSYALMLSPWVLILSWAWKRYALQEIAGKFEISKAWIVWIPVLHVWIPGSISDRWRQQKSGRAGHRRKLLLALRILRMILWAGFLCCLAGGLMDAAKILEKGAGERGAILMITYSILDGLWWLVPAVLLSLAGIVLEYLTLYDIFSACHPSGRVLYLILSLIPLVNLITHPLCLHLCRDRCGQNAQRHIPVEMEY